MTMHRGAVAIVGASETTTIGIRDDLSYVGLHCEAARNALADAGIRPSEVDGIATAGPVFAWEVSDALGIRPRWVDSTHIGGTSFIAHVRHAAAAIDSGAADVILITHGESGRSRIAAPPLPFGADFSTITGQFQEVYGAIPPYATFTVPVLAFLEARGMTRRHLAEVVVAQREWSTPNRRAARREPTSIDEVLAQRDVAFPFTKDMVCVVTDGGGALVLTSAERAKAMKNADRLVYVLGSGESIESTLIAEMDDLGSFGAFRRSASEAFRVAGLGPKDIDHLMVYDAFAHLPLYGLEDLGFVGFGESGQFIADGHTRPGGQLPMNTNGGGLSYTHSGMYGMFALQESVRQLRGEACVQVDGVTTSLVQGVGAMFSAAATVILSNEVL
ncbi:thiolase [Gulosibacter macacae]|uniref:Thiolase n=1 Tax=Gulosibacter macacae TaxID=2488791 RepID=A0A3P3VVW2_9MICO|nr:thiolase [Gulosibacter macacae]RRJ86594.1 thiolase [Gulosibacter macacae]